MKMLKKLALVSAVSMISAGAFAMEALDEETMAATTGQDGITILVKPGVISRADANATYGVSLATIGKVADPSAGYYANGDTDVNGLTIKQVVIHDNDGWTNGANSFGDSFGGTAGTTDNSGALVIGDGNVADSTVVLADGSKGIVIDLDMVGDSGASNKAMLNIRITTPRLAIKVGSIGIADSFNSSASALPADITTTVGNGVGGAYAAGTQDNDTTVGVDGNQHRGRVTIMNSMEIVMGEAVTNIQLGGESQGAMIVLDTSLIGGLAINNFALNDTAGVCNAATCTAPTALGDVITGGGSIAVGALSMKDAGGANLTVKAKVDVGSVNTLTYAPGELSAVKDDLAVANGFANYAAVPAGPTKTAIDTKSGQLQGVTQGAYNGLVVQLTQVGHASNGIDMALNDVRVGDAAAKNIGDIQMLGLNIKNTTLVISGH